MERIAVFKQTFAICGTTEQTTSAIDTLLGLCHNDNTCISKWFAYFVVFHYSPPFGSKSLTYAQRLMA